MEKVLISIPNELAARMRAVIPVRQRSKALASLLEKEVQKRENALYKCALAVEKDSLLHDQMKDWDVTLHDGLEDETW